MINDKKYIPMPCGGNGICGKCRIKVMKGSLEPNDRDRKFLSDDEIKDGIRIACGHNISDDIEYISVNEDFKTVIQYYNGCTESDIPRDGLDGYAVIIDAGTTTLCFSLIDKQGNEIKTYSAANSQRAFGADVLSRISKASAGGFSQLSDMLKNDLKRGISEVCRDFSDVVSDVFIAGNTVMTYFLRNMDCRSLGVYPFENNANDTFKESALKFFGSTMYFAENAKVTILPCIQAFVGGDIASGAFFLDMDKKENCIFIDIGTNGEIMLNSKGRLYCSSVAAGPAFEGGTVSCGSAGIGGAVNSIKYEDGAFKYTTIGNKPPVGICGSALIDLLAILLEYGFIDDSGLLREEYFEKGVHVAKGIFITQKDIRELQLAKSAVFSGIQCILEYAGISPYDIEKVYIGGGFGFYLNCESLYKIKMLPKEFSGKTEICGNTALGGLMKAYKTGECGYERFVSDTESLNLAETESFQKVFIENLNF